MDRLRWAVVRLGVRVACLRRRPGTAVWRLRQVTDRRPGDLEVRLLLAELELAVGDVDRAIAEAGMAIQLAPDDLRGMTLLLRAQARSELKAS